MYSKKGEIIIMMNISNLEALFYNYRISISKGTLIIL
jgi:hypothetical protein